DAGAFAEKVYDALTFVRANYIKKLNLGEMASSGIKGLYKGAEVKLPDPVNEQLAKAKDLSDKEVKTLLKDARAPLGKREDLDEDKDVGIATRLALKKYVDDYTTYVDKENVVELDKRLDGRFRGIGVIIRRDIARDGLLVVT